jgi:hypothetical protein
MPMALDWEDGNDSGSGTVSFNNPTFEKKFYTIAGDESEAVARAEANLPPLLTVNSKILFINQYKPEPYGDGGNLWVVTATYKYEETFTEMSFDTSGGTRKVMQALDEGDYYRCDGGGDPNDRTPAGQGVQSFNGLIGVNGDSVEGTEAPLPDKFDFTMLFRMKLAAISADYIDRLSSITGHANDRPITLIHRAKRFDFGLEELVFLGLPGKDDSEASVEFSLKFSRSKSKKGGTVVTADYVQPTPGMAVSVAFRTTVGMTVGERIWIKGGGTYEVAFIINGTSASIILDGGGTGAEPGGTVAAGAPVNFDQFDRNPITVAKSGPIKKLGWRYMQVIPRTMLMGATFSGGRFRGGTRIPQPGIVTVNQVIPTADFSVIGIFT